MCGEEPGEVSVHNPVVCCYHRASGLFTELNFPLSGAVFQVLSIFLLLRITEAFLPVQSQVYTRKLWSLYVVGSGKDLDSLSLSLLLLSLKSIDQIKDHSLPSPLSPNLSLSLPQTSHSSAMLHLDCRCFYMLLVRVNENPPDLQGAESLT